MLYYGLLIEMQAIGELLTVTRPVAPGAKSTITSKIILKNFSMNIHEAVLQPIAAFVYDTHGGRNKECFLPARQ